MRSRAPATTRRRPLAKSVAAWRRSLHLPGPPRGGTGLRWSRHVSHFRLGLPDRFGPPHRFGLYDPARESSACGVGFITRKDGRQSHDVIVRADTALCAIPHRGGMSSEGVGDGAGVSVDLSVRFFSALTGWPLEAGAFGVANLFMPTDPAQESRAREIVRTALERQGLEVLLERLVPVDPSALRSAAQRYQLPIVQWVFVAPADRARGDVDRAANAALLEIEQAAYESPELAGL